ncbi:MAG: 3-deoxy-8-phosphooctulonate synthase, partial [Gemmatimonadota bacterium]|nr:3-deoxy-8-phosphooctulonate synthase [Gemmatimonadota bacterium]
MTSEAIGRFSGRTTADGRRSLFLIAGPCVLENDTLNLTVAEHVAREAERHDMPAIFKASFDKANRSSPESARGPGLVRGCAALERVRESSGLPVLTDV